MMRRNLTISDMRDPPRVAGVALSCFDPGLMLPSAPFHGVAVLGRFPMSEDKPATGTAIRCA